MATRWRQAHRLWLWPPRRKRLVTQEQGWPFMSTGPVTTSNFQEICKWHHVRVMQQQGLIHTTTCTCACASIVYNSGLAFQHATGVHKNVGVSFHSHGDSQGQVPFDSSIIPHDNGVDKSFNKSNGSGILGTLNGHHFCGKVGQDAPKKRRMVATKQRAAPTRKIRTLCRRQQRKTNQNRLKRKGKRCPKDKRRQDSPSTATVSFLKSFLSQHDKVLQHQAN